MAPNNPFQGAPGQFPNMMHPQTPPGQSPNMVFSQTHPARSAWHGPMSQSSPEYAGMYEEFMRLIMSRDIFNPDIVSAIGVELVRCFSPQVNVVAAYAWCKVMREKGISSIFKRLKNLNKVSPVFQFNPSANIEISAVHNPHPNGCLTVSAAISNAITATHSAAISNATTATHTPLSSDDYFVNWAISQSGFDFNPDGLVVYLRCVANEHERSYISNLVTAILTVCDKEVSEKSMSADCFANLLKSAFYTASLLIESASTVGETKIYPTHPLARKITFIPNDGDNTTGRLDVVSSTEEELVVKLMSNLAWNNGQSGHAMGSQGASPLNNFTRY